MNTENQVEANQAKRRLNVALFTYMLAKPLINALSERFRRGEQSVQKTVQTTQPDARQRLNELTLESRQWVAEQIQQLNEQARQLQLQSRQLGKAVRREAKQRRKLVDQVRKSGIDWRQDLLKRGGQLSGDLVERGGKLTQDLLERSGVFAQGLTERRGKIAQELTERGEHLMKPVRKRYRNFWIIVGVVAGLVAAGVVTYRLVRWRTAEQESEQDEQIELSQTEAWNGTQGRPAGEIRHLDQEGVTVATIPTTIEVEITERPVDAAFVGIMSTKQYYPIDTPLEPEDLVYFASEEEAQTRGFTSAQ